ncbi:hypothetical protein L5515_015192 [Caenorhabditis briggsae]|uniref:ShKT domain-containing protein n=3 Tax=Caenorhabditis briggsae TaxID=6238 RepID=A0AAE9DN81_CAEBR|nr:hypothetical protein L3Y34_019066 [Caenorhabditis briggsae]UMM19710.1 hypothetical protein L5515_015192 [Caenorhabditis briggsae]
MFFLLFSSGIMYKLLALLAVFSASAWAQQTTCRVATLGPAISNLCPVGYTVISSGDCCPTSSVATSTTSTTCADKTNAQGVNECPGLKSYCNNSLYKQLMTEQCAKTCGFCSPSNTCQDLTNPNTGRSDCAANANKCNDSLYREMMKTQCPKTCGYCK